MSQKSIGAIGKAPKEGAASGKTFSVTAASVRLKFLRVRGVWGATSVLTIAPFPVRQLESANVFRLLCRRLCSAQGSQSSKGSFICGERSVEDDSTGAQEPLKSPNVVHESEEVVLGAHGGGSEGGGPHFGSLLIELERVQWSLLALFSQDSQLSSFMFKDFSIVDAFAFTNGSLL